MFDMWEKIPGYDGYMASNLGNIKSVDRKIIDGRTGEKTKNVKGRLLVLNKRTDGYLCVTINGKTVMVHRLIAKTFLKDFDKFPEVNHIDGIKNNNNVENLEMVTRSQNAIHMYKKGLMTAPHLGKKGKLSHLSIRVQGIKNGIIVHNFDCIEDANSFGFNSSCISRASRGIQKTHKGLIWILAH